MINRKIQMRELVAFCENYNAISYGEAKIIELKSKFIITLCNAGFSENEEQDVIFKTRYKSDIIYDRHPLIIAEFSTLDLRYGNSVIDFDNMKDWCDCYEKQDKFELKIDIE